MPPLYDRRTRELSSHRFGPSTVLFLFLVPYVDPACRKSLNHSEIFTVSWQMRVSNSSMFVWSDGPKRKLVFLDLRVRSVILQSGSTYGRFGAAVPSPDSPEKGDDTFRIFPNPVSILICVSLANLS